jgi:hypothetical protein
MYALRVQEMLSSKDGCVLGGICVEIKENVDRKEYLTYLDGWTEHFVVLL